MPRYTKFLAFPLILCMMLAAFAGCKESGFPQPPDPEENARMLEFPGTHWGDTPEEVKQELNLPQEELTEMPWDPDSGSEGGQAECVIAWEPADLQLFGQKVRAVGFSFRDFDVTDPEDAHFQLNRVVVVYDEKETDMPTVRENLTAYYGPDLGAKALPYNIYLSQEDYDAIQAGEGDDLATVWRATCTVGEAMPAHKLQAITEKLQTAIDNRPDSLKESDPDATPNDVLDAPEASLSYYTTAGSSWDWGEQELPELWSPCLLIFSGGNSQYYLHYYGE